VIVSANTQSFIPNFTGLSYINCLIPLNLCFDLIILSSTAIFSFGWKKSWETLPAWSINGYTLVNLLSLSIPQFFLIFGEKRTEITDISKDLFSIYFLIFLIMDSFYTTYNLVNDLFKKQVYVIGAVRSNSLVLP
jgi:hypothetical protein